MTAGRKPALSAVRAPAPVRTLWCVAARLRPFTVQRLLSALLADPEGSEPLWDWNPGPQAHVQAASPVPGSPPPLPLCPLRLLLLLGFVTGSPAGASSRGQVCPACGCWPSGSAMNLSGSGFTRSPSCVTHPPEPTHRLPLDQQKLGRRVWRCRESWTRSVLLTVTFPELGPQPGTRLGLNYLLSG